MSFLQAYRAVRLALVIQKDWGKLRQEPLSRYKLALAEDAAFYLAVPPAVLLHELFHALPIYAWGGKVINCGYGFYWGYVQADRFFSVPQEWFIALAGTLGSLLMGLLYYVVVRNHPSRTIQFFGLRAFRFQIYFSLLIYPIFTAFTFIGDWRTIYNFEATPFLSGATAVLHISLLALYYWADRNGRFEMVAHESVEAQERFAALRTQAMMNPHDTAVQFQYVDYLRRGSATHQARAYLQQILKQHPDSGEGLWQLTLLDLDKKQTISPSTAATIRKALQLGLPERELPQAHYLLGRYHIDRGKEAEAITHFNQALSAKSSIQSTLQANSYYWRSLAHRRQQQFELAYRDMQNALRVAQDIGDEAMIARLQEELKLIEQHAGRPLGTTVPEHKESDA